VVFRPRLEPYLSNTSHRIYHSPGSSLSSLLFFASSASSYSNSLPSFFSSTFHHCLTFTFLHYSTHFFYSTSLTTLFFCNCYHISFDPSFCPSILVFSSSSSTFFPKKKQRFFFEPWSIAHNNVEWSMMHNVSNAPLPSVTLCKCSVFTDSATADRQMGPFRSGCCSQLHQHSTHEAKVRIRLLSSRKLTSHAWCCLEEVMNLTVGRHPKTRVRTVRVIYCHNIHNS
jgi:hypothetical protein